MVILHLALDLDTPETIGHLRYMEDDDDFSFFWSSELMRWMTDHKIAPSVEIAYNHSIFWGDAREVTGIDLAFNTEQEMILFKLRWL